MTDQTATLYNTYESSLKEGKYKLDLSQIVSGGGKAFPDELATTVQFEIGKTRHRIEDHEIFSMHPPVGAKGDFHKNLPHVILENGLMPWEKDLEWAEDLEKSGNVKYPWLALILIDQSERSLIQEKVVSIEGTVVRKIALSVSFFNRLFALSGSADSKKQKLLMTISNLVHVRKNHKTERACILANRLPVPGNVATVYLISLENLTENDFEIENEIELTSLFSYNFHANLETDEVLEHLTSLNASVINTSFSEPTSEVIQKLQANSFIPVRHLQRDNTDNHSLYRGPLVPGKNSETIDLVRKSDDLIRKHDETGLWDITYAAAWNLGRSLALSSSATRRILINSMRKHLQKSKAEIVEKHLQHTELLKLIGRSYHAERVLHVSQNSKETHQIFDSWMKLENLPFQYLIPDERMIPPESIRFFSLDEAWLKAFINGAYNVAMLNQPDQDLFELHWEEFWMEARSTWKKEEPCGFLMHSDVVSHLPEFQIVGKTKSSNSSPYLTRKFGRLLFVLFHEKPDELIIAKPNVTMQAEISDETFFDADSRVLAMEDLMNSLTSNKNQKVESAELAKKVMKTSTGVSFKWPS